MATNASPSPPGRRKADWNSASTSYSHIPGFSARMTSRCPATVMSIARPSIACSAGLFRVRRLSRIGCASRTVTPGCPSANCRMKCAPRVSESVWAASAVAKSRRV